MRRFQPYLIMAIAIAIMSVLLHPTEQAPISENPSEAANSVQLEPSQAAPSTAIQAAFLEIAIDSASQNPEDQRIHKWTQPIRIKVEGHPTQTDLITLDSVIKDINSMITDSIQLQRVNPTSTAKANVALRFIPQTQFKTKEPTSAATSKNFFRLSSDAASRIQYAIVLISTTGTTQQERSYFIRKNLAQALGLPNHTDREDSIFTQQSIVRTNYSSFDQQVIALLYSSKIQAGMTREAVEAALRS